MKKKNLKNLKLNKKSISSLDIQKTRGGAIDISVLIGCVTAGTCPIEVSDSCESYGSVFECECGL